MSSNFAMIWSEVVVLVAEIVLSLKTHWFDRQSPSPLM
jgi:hypothetical protein